MQPVRMQEWDCLCAGRRRQLRSNYDFTLLDRRRRAGWDLACKLVRKRNGLMHGRLSVSQALRHRYFIPEI